MSVDADDRTLRVTYLRGLWLALHSVDVALRPDEIAVTVLLGLTHEHVERAARGEELAYALGGIEECTSVVLTEPVGDRPIVDTLPDVDGGGVTRRRR